MNAVFGSILENLKAIEIVDDSTVEVFRSDKTFTGDSKEFTVQQFIQKYLPKDFDVKKGKIFSLASESNNIDCVILAPNHPTLITPVREVILAEGVYAAVEVKPDISVLTEKSELMRGLIQIQSVKKLERKVNLASLTEIYEMAKGEIDKLKKPDYYKKIPSVIFSFNSSDTEKTINFIIGKVKDGTLGSDELPDLIMTLDRGIIFYTPHISSTGFFHKLTNEQKKIFGERVFIHFETNRREVSLAMFLLFLLNFTPPTILNHDFIIKEYLAKIDANFKTKFYPLEIDMMRATEIIMENMVTEMQNIDL